MKLSSKFLVETLDKYVLTSTSNIQLQLEALWQALPTHFRLDGDLKQYADTPFQCDFLLSTRLNYLHVKFLLQFVTLDYGASLSHTFINVAHEILSLVVEGILLRERLANSGTGLVWKVCCANELKKHVADFVQLDCTLWFAGRRYPPS